MKLVVSEANEPEGGHRQGALGASLQRCLVHFVRNGSLTANDETGELHAATILGTFGACPDDFAKILTGG